MAVISTEQDNSTIVLFQTIFLVVFLPKDKEISFQ